MWPWISHLIYMNLSFLFSFCAVTLLETVCNTSELFHWKVRKLDFTYPSPSPLTVTPGINSWGLLACSSGEPSPLLEPEKTLRWKDAGTKCIQVLCEGGCWVDGGMGISMGSSCCWCTAAKDLKIIRGLSPALTQHGCAFMFLQTRAFPTFLTNIHS